MIAAPKALFFDLDGTLVDSRGDIAASLNAALAVNDREPLPESVIVPMVGDGARMLVVRALSVSPGPTVDDAFVEQVVASFRAHYVAHPCVHTTLLPGARELLSAAKVPCAVITNKPRDISLLVLEALDVSVAAVWGGGDGPLKPSPDGVVAIASQLGVSPRDVWMIGDSPQDIAAGRAAGAFTVGVPGIAERALLEASDPDAMCASLYDVAALIAG